MKIYLVRHGETEWNRAGRMQGHLDAPLTMRGEAQARAVGETLRELGVGGFSMVASPLGRTRATAAIIARARLVDGAGRLTSRYGFLDLDGLRR